MKYIDLIEQLSDLDKKRIENYIFCYGVKPDFYIGSEKWLQNWSHSNQILYKLLGNSFIYTIPIEIPKEEFMLSMEICDDLFVLPFKKIYHNFYVKYIVPTYDKGEMTFEQKNFFNHLLDVNNLIKNQIYHGIKYKKKDSDKMLQIQIGMKPMKAIQKVIEYFKNDFDFGETFEEFRLAHSRILNNKQLKGELCFSIHPLDFMTMSDNSLKWSSCMSWKEKGCYHIGTVEMMNSNNVVCCYLKSLSTDFVFDNTVQNKEEGTWNNKKWRCLGYVTKDIIMSGKAYPYKSTELSNKIIDVLKDLAEKNLGWTYKFGPEPYSDMVHINSEYTMMRARDYRANKRTNFKKNILWDTKGMYNDMLNDSDGGYMCYRNKVERTKIISVSGKAPCLCCNNKVITGRDSDYSDYYDSYNERFYNAGNVICEECLSEKKTICDLCNGGIKPNSKTYILNFEDGTTKTACFSCLNGNIHVCNCCKKVIISSYFESGIPNYNKIYLSFGLKYLIKEENCQIEANGEKLYPSWLASWYSDLYNSEVLLKEIDEHKSMKKNLNYEIYFCENCTKKIMTENVIKEAYIYSRYNTFALKYLLIDMDDKVTYDKWIDYLKDPRYRERETTEEVQVTKKLFSDNSLKEDCIISNIVNRYGYNKKDYLHRDNSNDWGRNYY